jgi:hypothetical protein
MEIARLVLEYLKALTWPLVALAVALIYKNQVVKVLGRLKKAHLPGGISVELSQEVIEVQQLSARVRALPTREEHGGRPGIPLTEANARMISLRLRPSPSGLDMDYYRAFARQDPNIALAGLRMEIDVLARNLAEGFRVPVVAGQSGLRLLRTLSQRGAIDDSQFELAEKVIRLCNAAVHGTAISREQAEAVLDSAEVLTRQFMHWLSWGFPDGWQSTAPSEKS